MNKTITGHLAEKRGLYYVVLCYPPDGSGKRKRQWCSTGLSTNRNETKAKAMLKEMVRDARKGKEIHGVCERKARPVVESKDARNGPYPEMLFSDYLCFWVEWKRNTWEEITYDSYRRTVRNRIAPYFQEKKIKLNELNLVHIQQFYSYLANVRGNSNNTILHLHANIRKSLADARKLKLIAENPAEMVERPKIDNRMATYYDSEELKELLRIMKGSRIELPVILAAYYGLRRSEALGLCWSAVDFNKKTITICRTIESVRIDGERKIVEKNRTKNKSSFRTLPLIPEVERILLETKERQKENRKLCGKSYCTRYLDYICVNEVGEIIKPDYVSTTFRDTLKRHNMKIIRFHDLRHSCASLLLENNISLKQIQIWLGHSDFSTTANIYAHLSTESKQIAAGTISGCLG